jgi:hypothetical protein
VVTDGNYIIEWDIKQLSHVFRALPSDVNTRLGHDPNGEWIEPTDLGPRRKRLDEIAFEIPRPSFRHLTAAGIAGAEKKEL